MVMLLLFQLGFPLLLIAWLWFWPLPDRFAPVMQIAAVCSLIAALWMAGLWTTIPRWSLAIVTALALGAAIRGVARQSGPPTRRRWLHLGLGVSLLIAGSGLLASIWRGHQPPPGPSINLAIPLAGSDIVVANGGSRLLLNTHQDTLDLSVPRHRSWYGQSYAVDFVALNRAGMTSNGWQPADPRRYAIFGRLVRAVCDGEVVATQSSLPDMPVPKVDRRNMEGNHVLLRCADADILFAHLQRGSVIVQPGQHIKTGDIVGAVGNSGFSDEPHLHIHAQTPGTSATPYSGKPVAMLFNSRFLARNDRI